MFRTTALFATGCLLAAGVAGADDRVPVPPPEAVEQASKLVRMLFKNEFARTTPKARVALAEKLFKQAEETPDDPAARLVLLRDAADLAAAGGDVDLALRASDALRARFSGLKPEQTEGLIRALIPRAATAEAGAVLTDHAMKLVDEAVASDDLDAAERLVKQADLAARKSKSRRAFDEVSARAREIDEFKKDAPKVKEALAALKQNPADAGASTTAGKYHAFQKGDWTKGLPLLAACDDAKLREVAKKEIADPDDPAEMLAVADAWFELGGAATGAAKRAMLARALTFYGKAAPDLTGLSRTRAEKRIEEIEKQVEGKGLHDELFAAVRAAVRSRETEDLTPQGGFATQKAYREAAPSGGVLVGFHYTTRLFNNDHLVMDFLQPIYLTPTGEKLGKPYGKVPAKYQTVKARTGYAVGGLKIRGGGLLEGMGVTFLRIKGKSLSPAEKYESPWLGRVLDARAIQFMPLMGGDGRAAVGILGTLDDGGFGDRDIGIRTIGLVLAGPKPKK
jgi:hypothetical protein